MPRYIYYKTEKDLQKTMQFSTAIKYNSKNISMIIRQIEKKALAALLSHVILAQSKPYLV